MDACKAWALLWLIPDDSLMMMIICLGYSCTLVCYLILVGTWISPILWDCNSITLWAIYTSPSLYKMVDEDKEARIHSIYPLTNSLYQISIGIKFHDCNFGYTSAIPCKTNPCRKMDFKFQRMLPTLDELHQPWASYTSSTTWSRSTPPPRYVIPS